MADPKFIDHFEIIRELGNGGMGKVYLAQDTRLDRPVAIKVMRLDRAHPEWNARQYEEMLERFRREAKIAAKLDHPGIVSLYDVGRCDHGPYLVMQFIEGTSLEDLLLREPGRPFDCAEAIRILKEAAVALDYAHGMSIIHRDIKPGNIMVTRTGAVKICDFGIAKSLEVSREVSTVLIGTPSYMAPEQLTWKPTDRATDQWALGIVAYELLTGRVPFRGTDETSLQSSIIGAPMPTPQKVNPALAPDLTKVLEKALSKDPARRYSTCSDFAADLASALGSVVETQPLKVVLIAAKRYLRERQYHLALPLFRLAAEAGSEKAACCLGVMYEAGLGVYDNALAVNWYRKAADAGYAPGMENLGRMYEHGKGGLPKDDALAVSWYRKGADAGHIGCRSELERRTAAGERPRRAGETMVNPEDGLTYVWIPPGTFRMGCSPGDSECNDNEKPAHEVTITRGYWMGQTPVTNEAYERVMGMIPRCLLALGERRHRAEKARHAVITVTWEEAQSYCEAVGMRLPTEAEWEYAARAGTSGSRYGELDHIAWYHGNMMHPVGEKKPNAWGLYDMLGNMWEWVADWYAEYPDWPQRDPAGPATGNRRAARGGVRASIRTSWQPRRAVDFIVGFRCAGN